MLEITDHRVTVTGYVTTFKHNLYVNRKVFDRLVDLFLKRVNVDGWPTRDSAAPQEDC